MMARQELRRMKGFEYSPWVQVAVSIAIIASLSFHMSWELEYDKGY